MGRLHDERAACAGRERALTEGEGTINPKEVG
jgi:hypothetical protein